MSLRVTELWIWPVKGCAGLRVDAVAADAFGPVGDRRYMIVDDSGTMLTQRSEPRLAQIAPRLAGERLVLVGRDDEPIGEAEADGSRMQATVWRDVVDARDCGDAVARGLSRFLGRSARLVAMDPAYRRPVDPDWSRRPAQTSFTDGFPWLLIHQASLRALGDAAMRGLETARFRPNIVIEGGQPFAEDRWTTIQIGKVAFQVAKPCTRCRVITLDPATGQQDAPRLLRTLAELRPDGKAVFGQNLVHLTDGVVRAGDLVRIVA